MEGAVQRKCRCVRHAKNSALLIGITAELISIIFFKTISYQMEKINFFCFRKKIFFAKVRKKFVGAKKHFSEFFGIAFSFLHSGHFQNWSTLAVAMAKNPENWRFFDRP